MVVRTKVEPAYLRSLFEYHPASPTGEITWRVARQRIQKDSIAGSPHRDGYLVVRIDGTMHRVANIAWVLLYHKHPRVDVIHVNGDKTDNSKRNLHVPAVDEPTDRAFPPAKASGHPPEKETGKVDSEGYKSDWDGWEGHDELIGDGFNWIERTE